jgi:hypothetical protein
MLCNVAYFAAVPKADILTAKTTTASLFFTAVFGSQAAKGLNLLVILSAFGNLVTVLIGQSRVIREIGRQGVLPYPKFWVTTKPFGTPIGPYLLKWAMTVLMIVAPPAGDAFDFGMCSAEALTSKRLNLLTSTHSGRPPKLPRVNVLFRHGCRYIPDPTSTQQDRAREVRVQGVGCCNWLVHSGKSPASRHAVGSTERWCQWWLCKLLVRHVLCNRHWNVSILKV